MTTNTTNLWMNGVAATLITLLFIAPQLSNAQTVTGNDLSLTSIKPMDVKSGTAFHLNFETAEETIMGVAKTTVEGYDSLAISSYERLETDQGSLIKIKGFLVSKDSQNQLRWTSAVNYTSSSKLLGLAGGTYVQFAAYNKLAHAREGLKFFKGFDIDIIKVDAMYKLVAPYTKETFVAAKEQYAEYNIWSVKYEAIQLASLD